jgi:hypothetical protein
MPTLTLPQFGCISDPNKIVRQIGDMIRRLAVPRSRTARPCFGRRIAAGVALSAIGTARLRQAATP